MSIDRIMREIYHGGLQDAYGYEMTTSIVRTSVIGFFCIEDWGPWE